MGSIQWDDLFAIGFVDQKLGVNTNWNNMLTDLSSIALSGLVDLESCTKQTIDDSKYSWQQDNLLTDTNTGNYYVDIVPLVTVWPLRVSSAMI